MTATQDMVRKGRKFDQVLDGARKVFMADGFEGASVDEIARVAAVSKATLYSYFPDKRLLFMEVARTECQRQAAHAMDSIDMAAPPRIVLGRPGSISCASSRPSSGCRCFVSVSRNPTGFLRWGGSSSALARRSCRRKCRPISCRQNSAGNSSIEDPGPGGVPVWRDVQGRPLDAVDVWRDTHGHRRRNRPRCDGAVETFLARYGT